MPFILIIANSGRMLAQAAYHAGFKVLAIDLYADLDTLQFATEARQIKSLAECHLKPAVDYFLKRYAVSLAIYGSGFEYYPESLVYLESRLQLLGNTAEVFARLQNKPVFFSALEKFSIPYPETAFIKPQQTEGWLLKPLQGQGGIGIQRYQPGLLNDSLGYWQKFQCGSVCSVLFVADGVTAQVLGFNTQWAVDLPGQAEFAFAGVINHCVLTGQHKNRIGHWLSQLVPYFALKGLNAMDFIQDGDGCYVLEINPRPSASMQLYGHDALVQHIAACQHGLVADLPKQTGFSAYQIVYAPVDIQIPKGFSWPDGCMDLPNSGALVHTGQPICSIIAYDNEPELVLAQLMLRQQELLTNLKGV